MHKCLHGLPDVNDGTVGCIAWTPFSAAFTSRPHSRHFSGPHSRDGFIVEPRNISAPFEAETHVNYHHTGASSIREPQSFTNKAHKLLISNAALSKLDVDLEAELAKLSPLSINRTVANDLPAALSSQKPAMVSLKYDDAGSTMCIRVAWVYGKDDVEESGEIKRATERALEWARKMFMNDLEREEEESVWAEQALQ